MLFSFAELTPRDRYKLMVSTVTPRPVAWVTTRGADGSVNAAPYSFFNAFGMTEPCVGIGVGAQPGGGDKDTRRNIAVGEGFVVNLVSEQLAEAMNVTAIDFPYGVDELQQAGLTAAASSQVEAPRIAEAPVSIEARCFQLVDLGHGDTLVVGRVLAMHVADRFVQDAERRHIDTPALNLVGRMHASGWYARTSDLFDMPRIALKDWSVEDRRRRP